VTDRRAYLDRGSRDGLEAKQSLAIQRAGRPVATCTVEAAASRSAVCVGARLRGGDTFALPARTAPVKAAAVVALAPVTPATTLQQRAEEMADAPQEKVDFQGVRLFGGHARAQLGAVMAFWRTQSDPRFNYALEQLDGAVRAYEIGNTGLRVDAAFSAMRWTGSGAAVASRFRPDAQTQFYLWQAEVSRRREDAGTVVSVGRIWPWHLPGLPLLDGFQLGRRNRAGTQEAGVYAGFLPTATAVSPATDSWVAGLYGTVTQVGLGRGVFRLAREEARVGVWRTGGAGWIAEGDGTGQVWLGPTTLAAGGRVRAGAEVGSALDRFFLDFAVRPTNLLGGGLHFRYFGASPGPLTDLVRESFATKGSVHALADLHLQPWSWLGFAGFGGVHRERESGLGQKLGGAEVRLPRVAGSYAGLNVGAEAQEGWLRLRTLYADLVARPTKGIVAWARLSAVASQIPAPVATAELHELGGQLHIDAALASWLRVQAWCALKSPWLIRGEPPPVASTGLTAGVGARGVF